MFLKTRLNSGFFHYVTLSFFPEAEVFL